MNYQWDRYFLRLAREASSKSKDPSTKVGAIIVRPDRTIASIGFNGFPMGMDDKPEWYIDREIKYQRIVHGEMNALLFAREPVKGYTLYTWPFMPCSRCMIHMIQAGIQRFVWIKPSEEADKRWAKEFALSLQYIWEANKDFEEIRPEEIDEDLHNRVTEKQSDT